MPAEFTEQVVDRGTSGVAGDRVAPRAPIVETMDKDSRAGSGFLETYSDSKVARTLPDSVRERIEKLEKESADEAVEPDVDAAGDDTDKPADVTPPDPKAVKADPAPAKAAPAAAAVADPSAEHIARADRFEAANQRLVAELDAERKKPREVPAAHKLLAEATNDYIDDAPAALRKFIAVSLGVEDPNDKKVDQELRDLYTDLTAKELGVTPDPAHEAKRDAARARQLVAREKRERKAEGATTAEKVQHDADADQAKKAAEFIGNRLQTKRSDGRSLADDHPLLTKFSEKLDGLRPEALLWKVIERESKTGRLVIGADDDANIAAAAKLVESHYQDLADQFGKVKPSPLSNPSTATPSDPKSPAATKSASKDPRQSPGTRNLTTADASVAPASLPASASTTDAKKPKFKNDKARREYALRHLPK